MTMQQNLGLREIEEETYSIIKRASQVRREVLQPEIQDNLFYLWRAQHVLFRIDDRFNKLKTKIGLNKDYETPRCNQCIQLVDNTLDAFFNELYEQMKKAVGEKQ